MTTIYDNIDKHILEDYKYKLVSKINNLSDKNDLSGCNLLNWRGISIYVHPITSKIFINCNNRIEYLGSCNQTEKSLYENYNRLTYKKFDIVKNDQ